MYKLLIIENGTYIYKDDWINGILLYSEEEIKKYYQVTYQALFNTTEEIEEIFTRVHNYQEVEINGIGIKLEASSRNLFEIVEV